ncbi:MAG: permease prefix domain 1-containing protein [Lachnospiraceae bacterium]|nr:permease prefix domain 1-containing protein [Lachnospiraceae bacterium]
METIRNYLETMFAKLPNTNEIRRARSELWQMMEDKYMELMREGKTENEAIGIVISEFGNLDEISEDLGIKNLMVQEQFGASRAVTLEDVKEYFRDKSRSAYMRALGVFLCIVSVCGFLVKTADNWRRSGSIAVVFMFSAIAVAVGLFIYSSISMGKWQFLRKQKCSISFATAEYVHNRRDSFRVTYAMMITIGVILCILSVLPYVLLGILSVGMANVLMFILVGVGVFLLVAAGNISAGYTVVLSLNKGDTMGAEFVPSQRQVRYNNETVEKVMSVYWPTVTCIYLCWSFLSFDWHFTWIVWVIAAVVAMLIKNIYRD